MRRAFELESQANNRNSIAGGEQTLKFFLLRAGEKWAGNQVFYAVRDPLIRKVPDLMVGDSQKQVGESMAMLVEIEKAGERR